MIQDYRIVLEVAQIDVISDAWTTLGEKHIRTKSLNSAKAQATNFCFRFPEEMGDFWGQEDSGWSKSPQENTPDMLFCVRYRRSYAQPKIAVLRVEWQNPQLNLFHDRRIFDQRIHESWIKSCWAKKLSDLLK